MEKLHLISAMYTVKGHGQEYISNFCAELKEHYEIVLHLASNPDVEVPDGIKAIYTGIDYKSTEAQKFNKYAALAPYLRALTKQFLSRKYYKEILKSDQLEKGDLVYIMDYDVIPLNMLIKGLSKKGTRNFLWIHSAKFESKNVIYTAYKSIFKRKFEKFISEKIEGIIVNGNYIKEKIQFYLKVPPQKIFVIQYPSSIPFKMIDKGLARKKLDIQPNSNIILSFGMLRKDKNIEFLIESVSKVKSDVTLLIVGSEASVTKNDIEWWIQKYNLKSYKLDIDYISEERMAFYYSASDVLLLTYEIESGSQSGPLSLAREFELPAIVTNTGEIGRYVEDTGVGLLANLEIKNDFAQKIDSFFNNIERKKQIVSNTRDAKGLYSWKSAKNKYLMAFNAK
ncbi:MAG: glycosyltransferase family 4 protein [Bacteroidota bacterium]|nr:glycosyltransferase family 4 protein [Bacteroidota bacterium]